jgi:KDO2-lipid IV(A) lauroyltransferase
MEYAALRAAVWVPNLLPLRAALCLGSALGWMAWRVFRIRRDVCMTNLRMAFPSAGDDRLDRIGLRSYRNVGRFVMEFARQPRLGERHLRRYVRLSDPERVQRYKAMETGVIGLSFHFGNWELLGVIQKMLGFDIHFLVGRQRNRLVDDFINRLRAAHGIELISMDSAMRRIVRIARQGGMVCWLSDQDAGGDGLVVDFLGCPASTPRGAARFSVKLGVPILCGFLVRKQGPEQVLELSELLYPDPDLSGEEAERELTQRYTDVLAEMVRRHPEQYWWPHRRWKTTGLYDGNLVGGDGFRDIEGTGKKGSSGEAST